MPNLTFKVLDWDLDDKVRSFLGNHPKCLELNTAMPHNDMKDGFIKNVDSWQDCGK